MAMATEHGLSFHQPPEKAALGERVAQGTVLCNSRNRQVSDFPVPPGVPTKDCAESASQQ